MKNKNVTGDNSHINFFMEILNETIKMSDLARIAAEQDFNVNIDIRLPPVKQRFQLDSVRVEIYFYTYSGMTGHKDIKYSAAAFFADHMFEYFYDDPHDIPNEVLKKYLNPQKHYLKAVWDNRKELNDNFSSSSADIKTYLQNLLILQ